MKKKAIIISLKGKTLSKKEKMLLLKERIGFFRWSAIFIGFSGVLIIMNPRSELFSFFSIFPLLAALCWAISNIVLKFIPDDISSVKINFY